MSNSKNLKTVLNTSICLAIAAIASQAAYAADVKAKTKGGFELISEDGEFSAKLGARIHLDANYFLNEDDLSATDKSNSTAFFRRARLSLTGKAYGWKYEFENDFAGQSGTTGSGFRDMWISTNVAGHEVQFGQAKPFRGMEELTSSNHVTMMERPMNSGSGLYRQRQIGVFASNSFDNGGYGVSVFNTRSAGDRATQGLGYNGRGYFTPINSDKAVLHIGASASVEQNPVKEAGDTGFTAADPTSNTTFVFQPRVVGRDGGLRPTLVGISSEQSTYTVELAGMYGPFTAQAEYAKASFDRVSTTAATAGQAIGSEDIDTYYVQGSYFITGESKRYDNKNGRFTSPSIGETGALELKARYDVAENTDTDAEATILTVGFNYYFNPTVRAMVEYVDGEATSATGVKTDATAVQARLQYAF